MKNFLNYFGQFRFYSFLDLIILLIAIHAHTVDFLGIIFLHLGFLAFLETAHSHPFRKNMPKWVWPLLTVIGIVLYRHWEVIPFLFFSWLYTKKTQGYLGTLSSFSRGMQFFFLVGGIIGYHTSFAYIVFAAVFVRNLLGDFRDIVKDSKENMKTLPIIFGFKKDQKYVHLFALLFTSIIWWSFTDLSVLILIPLLALEILTYNLTPR